MKFIAMILLLFGVACCSRESSGSSGSRHLEERRISREKADEFLEKLNSWDKEELARVEGTLVEVGVFPSGQSSGWVMGRKREIAELGFSVKWDGKAMLYSIVD